MADPVPVRLAGPVDAGGPFAVALGGDRRRQRVEAERDAEAVAQLVLAGEHRAGVGLRLVRSAAQQVDQGELVVGVRAGPALAARRALLAKGGGIRGGLRGGLVEPAEAGEGEDTDEPAARGRPRCGPPV
ncbi:hypothetical protein [Streptomyces sp. NPDC058595]|uniref:hypothetical protein n=1 Tax=Streptomyces sp. NPDC058595 TaxID=3346550 RepID=UPI00364B6135